MCGSDCCSRRTDLPLLQINRNLRHLDGRLVQKFWEEVDQLLATTKTHLEG